MIIPARLPQKSNSNSESKWNDNGGNELNPIFISFHRVLGVDKSDLPPRHSVMGHVRPPPPPPAQASPARTPATTETPQVIDTRPYCPGTCMAPILSFSCFSNAEITDLFRCPSAKVVCCAQKSAIRELRPSSGTVEIPQSEFGNSR